MSALHLRHAAAADLDGLLALYAQLNPDDPAPDRPRLAAILEHIVASECWSIIVAAQADNLRGVRVLGERQDGLRGAAGRCPLILVPAAAASRLSHARRSPAR